VPETITADAVPTGLVLRTFAVKEPPPAPPLRVGTLEYQMVCTFKKKGGRGRRRRERKENFQP